VAGVVLWVPTRLHVTLPLADALWLRNAFPDAQALEDFTSTALVLAVAEARQVGLPVPSARCVCGGRGWERGGPVNCSPQIEAQSRQWHAADAESADLRPAGPESPDEHLMALVASRNDAEAFAELFRRFYRRIVSYH